LLPNEVFLVGTGTALPPNEVDLHRMVWDPDDWDGAQLLPSAFPRSDLSVVGRFVSVDRVDEPFVQQALDRAEMQQDNADGSQHIRDEALSAFLNCGQVRELSDHEGTKPFSVSSYKEEGKPAHCGIENVTGKKSKGYINELRTLLVESVLEVVSLNTLNGRYP